MYIEHPFFYDGKYFAKVDGEFIEISKEVAYAMNNFYRSSRPKVIEVKDENGKVIEKYRREIPYSESLSDESGFSIDTMPDPLCDVEADALAGVVSEEVQEAIGKLSEIEKVIVRGIYFENMTVEAVGNLLGISHQAVSKRLKTILTKMRNYLSE